LNLALSFCKTFEMLENIVEGGEEDFAKLFLGD